MFESGENHECMCTGVMVLTAAVMVQAYSAYEVREAAREQAEVQKRLIQRLDTDALITELALAHLEGREPSEKAKAEIRPIPQ